MRSRSKQRAGARCPSFEASTASTISAAAPASASLASASSSVDSLDPSSGSSAEALTNSRRSITSPAARVASGPTRLPVDSSSSPPVSRAVTPGWLLQRAERVEAVRQHGEVAHRREAGRQPLQRRRGVDADRPTDADEVDQLVGDPSLGPRVLLGPGGELLGADGDGAAAHAVGDAFVDEHVEVAADRHLADVELAGELHHAHAPVDVEAPADQPEPVHALEVHDDTAFPGHAGRCWPLLVLAPRRSHVVGMRRLAQRPAGLGDASGTRRGRGPGTIALPSAVASTGPTVTEPSTCSASSRSSNADRAPPPNTCTLGSPSWPTTAAVDRAIDSTAQRMISACDGVGPSPAAATSSAAMSAGRGSARPWRRRRAPARRRRLGEQGVEVGIAPGAPALLDEPPAGDVAQEADAAGRTLLVGEATEPGRLRRVGTVEHAADEQPRAGRHVGRPVGRAAEHRRRRVVSADEVHRDAAPLADERARAADRRQQRRGGSVDGVDAAPPTSHRWPGRAGRSCRRWSARR